VYLGKKVFHCFHADCQAQGNALDFWSAYRHLPLYEAALDLAATFRLPRNREELPVEEPVKRPRATSSTSVVITTSEP
jgi:DNA primase